MLLRRVLIAALLTFILTAGALPVSAQEQGTVRLNSVEVDLWPEYDRPTMLVINHITLSSLVSLPAQLELSIPASSGEPHAVAVRQADGSLFSVAYERQVRDNWAVIRFTTTTPDVQLEYYDPGLEKKEDGSRHFDYQWPGDYAVSELQIVIQQPLGSEFLRVSPGIGSSRTGADGLVYYTVDVGALSAGQMFDIAIDYQKNTDVLSAANQQVEPSAPISADTAGRMTLTSALPWLLGGLGLLLIAGGGFWYWQSGRERNTQPTKRRTRRRTVTPAPETGTVARKEGEIYCHQCGKRAGPNDRFCRTCGTRLRTE